MRRRHNNIRLLEVDGVQISNHGGKITAMTEYVKGIIGQPGSSSMQFNLDNLFRDCPTPSTSITASFSESEAKKALFSMNCNSAPGPDGFRPSFYRVAWPTVKCHIMRFLDAFHCGEVDMDRINRSFMVLLPKKPDAVSVDAFRPICLQNCTVKTVAKVLTTRLQLHIHNLVDLNQTGFIKGRSISEGFVYAAELVQICHKRKLPTLVLKLDFAKAFDTVNWDGLQAVLHARGFSERWIGWVMNLLSSSKSAVIVNGCPGPWISCCRGLRQGDPMSPYLFLLVAETLQKLIQSYADVLVHPV